MDLSLLIFLGKHDQVRHRIASADPQDLTPGELDRAIHFAIADDKVDIVGLRLDAAAAADKTDDVRHLLIGGVDPNLPNMDGRTPLHYAALQGNSLGILRLLNYTTPDAAANVGDTPLHLYLRPSPGRAVPPDVQGLRYFIRASSDMFLKGSVGLTPLQILTSREDAPPALVDPLTQGKSCNC